MKLLLIGLFSGIISGIGMGGGTMLIFLLTYVIGIEQHVAQATNLIFFIPTSIISIIVNIRNKNINLKVTIIIIFFGILGAIIGVNLSVKTNVIVLKKFFGAFLVIIGVFEIFAINKQNKIIKNTKNK